MLLNYICTDDFHVIIMHKNNLHYAFLPQFNRLHDVKVTLDNFGNCVNYDIDKTKHYQIDFLEDHVKLGDTKMHVILTVDMDYNIKKYLW